MATAVSPSPTRTLPPTNTVIPLPTETPAPPLLPTPTPDPKDLSVEADDIFLYPVPAIYSGDKVTFQIFPYVPAHIDPTQVTAHLFVDDVEIAQGVLGQRNLQNDAIGIFPWAWDTTDLVGEHEVRVVLDMADTITVGDERLDNNELTLTIALLPATERPFLEKETEWVTQQTECCLIHVLSGTPAERDLSMLADVTETAVNQASQRLQERPARQLQVYFIDKVIGQGGYAGSNIIVSYLDRDYSGRGLYHVMVHEAVHVLDRQFAPQRIPFLAEGVAVWASDGHFKEDDLTQRVLAMQATGAYVPLRELIDDFYLAQHELGYSQAAGFVNYLVNAYGWQTFRTFYSEVTANELGGLAVAVDLKLQEHYNLTLEQMEAQWLATVNETAVDPTAITDLTTTMRYYDIMRRYQIQYDPTAYFLTAWLPHPQDVQTLGNPADFLRHPVTETTIAIEAMLQSSDIALRSGDYTQANLLLDSVTRVLDNNGSFIDPLSTTYLQIVREAQRMGFEVQYINIEGEMAEAQVLSAFRPTLSTLTFRFRNQNWVFTN